MRRLALLGPWLGSALLLSGCADYGDFLGDTLSLRTNPNQPIGDSENMRRVRGLEVRTEPLTPEPGNVWPTQVVTPPTLQDFEQQTRQGAGPAPRPDMTPYLPAHPQPRPGEPPVSANPPSRTYTTPQGPATSPGGPAVQTYTSPQGQNIVIPNGNGTSTVIHSDGRVETIPSPR